MEIKFGNYKLDQEKFNQLIAKADRQEQTTLKVLYNAVVKSINILNENSSAISVKDWDTTKNAYEEYSGKLWKRYFEESEPTSLDNVPAVVEYLTAAGWRIKKSAAYKHHKEGKLRPGDDGKYKISAVNKYAAVNLKRLDGKGKDFLERLTEEKARVELEKEKAKLEQIQHKNKMAAGLFVPREAFEQELAKRAAVLKSDVENFIRGGAEKTIALVAGDPAKAPALIEHQLDAAADWLNRYSGDKEFKVPAPAAAAAAATLQDDPDDEDE